MTLTLPEGISANLVRDLEQLQRKIAVLLNNHRVKRILTLAYFNQSFSDFFQILSRKLNSNPEVKLNLLTKLNI